MKFMLDTNIFDAVIETIGLVDHINDLAETGHVTIFTTHIQEDELARISDLSKRAKISQIRRSPVVTAGGVWGISVTGMSSFGDGSETGCSLGEIDSKKGKHTADALIATSASRDADVLVTNDKRLPKQIKKTNARCQVWNFEQFETYIEQLSEEKGLLPKGK